MTVTIYAVCKLVCEKEGDILETHIIKEAQSLSELSTKDISPGIFPAVFISRADIDRALSPDDYEESEPEEIDTEVAKLTDGEMIQIAADLQDVYVEYGSYWDDLESVCEDLHDE